jgi:hypothetical protein
MTGRFCEKHGGDVSEQNAFFLCDTCSREGINKCECGGHARYFGEALMKSVSCESCDAFVMHVGWDFNVVHAWNRGERGVISDRDDGSENGRSADNSEGQDKAGD